MRMPDVDVFKEKQEAQARRWVEERVRPYCQEQIDRVQQRLGPGQTVELVQELGTYWEIRFDPPLPGVTEDDLSSALGNAAHPDQADGPVDNEHARAYPELVRVARLIGDVCCVYNLAIGSIRPTGSKKRKLKKAGR